MDTHAETDRQAILDAEHLRLLSIGYMVSAGFCAFYALFGLVYAVMGGLMGAAITHEATRAGAGGPPAVFAWFFAFFGFAVFAAAAGLAALKLLTALRLRQRRSRTLCIVTAALTCFGIPYGTLIGVFTLLVLARPSVMSSFDANPAPGPSSPSA